jgi:uncharacterized protein YecE (DUF72 family)
VFDATEINSSFHRSHRPSTYARWAASVPANFRFAVKVPKTITHVHRLEAVDALLDAFIAEIAPLGRRLGCLLVQLPPKLVLAATVATRFFGTLRARYEGDVAVEPRHASWFTPAAADLLAAHRLARVAADPAPVPQAAQPGGWPELAYWRLHGSPQMYRSSYGAAELAALAEQLGVVQRRGARVWCIFDNTTLGAAAANALALRQRLDPAAR